MRRFNMFLTDPHDEALTKLAKERDVPVAHLVREALDLYLGWKKLYPEKRKPDAKKRK
jgi:hypothetical protein